MGLPQLAPQAGKDPALPLRTRGGPHTHKDSSSPRPKSGSLSSSCRGVQGVRAGWCVWGCSTGRGWGCCAAHKAPDAALCAVPSEASRPCCSHPHLANSPDFCALHSALPPPLPLQVEPHLREVRVLEQHVVCVDEHDGRAPDPGGRLIWARELPRELRLLLLLLLPVRCLHGDRRGGGGGGCGRLHRVSEPRQAGAAGHGWLQVHKAECSRPRPQEKPGGQP